MWFDHFGKKNLNIENNYMAKQKLKIFNIKLVYNTKNTRTL